MLSGWADRIVRFLNYARWRRRFGTFARSAYLETPELLVNERGVHVSWGAMVRAHARLECIEHEGRLGRIDIDEGTSVQYYFHCSAADRVTIGKNVLIAGRVYITDHDHLLPWREGRLVARPVTIHDGCWLGEGCAILKGVELGEGCVVGANAVVTRSFPPHTVVAGVPGRAIKRLDPQTGQYVPVRDLPQSDVPGRGPAPSPSNAAATADATTHAAATNADDANIRTVA